MSHSIKRLDKENYYRHKARAHDLYPWEMARMRHCERYMSKDEVKERLLHDVQKDRADTVTRPEARKKPDQSSE